MFRNRSLLYSNNSYSMSHLKEFDHIQIQQPLKSSHSGLSPNFLPPGWGASPLMTNELPQAFCLFKCSECQITKSSCEDLEIHIKVEHLNWQPFQCMMCSQARASDSQMREHVHSRHKKSDYKYIYIDNPPAKRALQGMIDQALASAIQQMVRQRSAAASSTTVAPKKNGLSSSSTSNGLNLAKRQHLHDVLSRNISHEGYERHSNSVSPDENRSNEKTDANDRLSVAESQSEGQAPELGALFGQENEVNMDPEESGVSSALLKTLEAASLKRESMDADEMLKNVSSLFSVDYNNFINPPLVSPKASTPLSNSGGSGKTGQRRRHGNQWQRGSVVASSTMSTSKKRVLGECIKCNKPVTAGARQMHMFFHLGKDENTYRFRCKFSNCGVQHYRKDQMENHMSKAHGRIDHDMMEDRTLELYDRIQQLSVELLGTVGNKPGPPVATGRYQIDYNRSVKSVESRDDDSPPSMVDSSNALNTFQSMFNQSDMNGEDESMVEESSDKAEENLECKLCRKKIVNRTRGFHILWHLCNDLGIIRYCCKFCDFKHERPQSVVTHGKKEHGAENCLEDSLNKYEEEIKSMSKACFGFEQLFSKESRRKNRTYMKSMYEDATPKMETDDYDAEENTESSELFTPVVAPASTTPKNASNTSALATTTGSGGSTRRRISTRRFGTRKPKSRKQREEMAKLREVSMKIGGALYFKKRSADAVYCEQCGKYVTNRLTHHAYEHLEGCDLFLCPKCDMGHYSRNLVIKHLRDFHSCGGNPTDNRLKFAVNIKEKIRECFPGVFVDTPIPTSAEIEELKKTLNINDLQLVIDGDGPLNDSAEGDEESHDEEFNVEQDENQEEEDEEAVEDPEVADDQLNHLGISVNGAQKVAEV